MPPEITKTEDQTPKTEGRFIWYFFIILIVFTYFFGLTIPLLGPDEPRYAQVARAMLDRGDWLTPTLGGFNWFEKPALFYWLEMVSYKIFGVTEFAARFGSALFGLGTIASLWILSRFSATENTEIISNAEDSKPPSKISVPSVANDFANWLAIIAASTIGILVFSRGASFDIIITFPITAALVSFFIWHTKNEIKKSSLPAGGMAVSEAPLLTKEGWRRFADGVVLPRRGDSLIYPLTLFYVFIGIAMLAKGLIGIVFPFAIVGFYYLLSRKLPGKMFILSLVWGTLLAIAIASIWYLPMYLQHGYQFIDEFFIQHHFQRFTSNKYQHPQPFYFFLWVLPLMTIPWLPFFIAAIWRFAREIFLHGGPETQRAGLGVAEGQSRKSLLLFCFAWLAVPLVFFSFSGSKLPGYILPAVPAAIILTADYVSRFVKKSPARRIAIQSTAAGFLFLSIILMIFVVPKYAESDSIKGLIAAADARGYSNQKLLSLHTISHNAEFYAAGRLIRTEDGKQRRFSGTAEVADEIRRSGTASVLVLVPVEYIKQLTATDLFHAEWIKDNGELAIVEVTLVKQT